MPNTQVTMQLLPSMKTFKAFENDAMATNGLMSRETSDCCFLW